MRPCTSCVCVHCMCLCVFKTNAYHLLSVLVQTTLHTFVVCAGSHRFWKGMAKRMQIVYCNDMSGILCEGERDEELLWTLWSHLSLQAERTLLKYFDFHAVLVLSFSASVYFRHTPHTHTRTQPHTHLNLSFVVCERSQYVSIQLSADSTISSALSGLLGNSDKKCRLSGPYGDKKW